jgi:glyoxylase-like metal-dependent hydrolase (beta-lactamase superfamily II)
MSATADIDIGIPGLRASPPQPLPFAPSLHARAFLLEREQGDVLVYSAETLKDPGTVTRWYLNHGHEAMFLPESLDAPLLVHEGDREAVQARTHVRAAFSRRFTLDDDFEAIPTPGHTPGATAYLWDNGEHRFLVTGDTIYLHEGEWVAAVLASSDRAAYVDSLALLRELEFDVLVPWIATAGREYHAVTSQTEARRRIDAIIGRLLDGAER